jgi:hypothetical protein
MKRFEFGRGKNVAILLMKTAVTHEIRKLVLLPRNGAHHHPLPSGVHIQFE